MNVLSLLRLANVRSSHKQDRQLFMQLQKNRKKRWKIKFIDKNQAESICGFLNKPRCSCLKSDCKKTNSNNTCRLHT